MSSRRLWWALGLVLLHGCYQPLPDPTEHVALSLASQVRDVEPLGPADLTPDKQVPSGIDVLPPSKTDPGREEAVKPADGPPAQPVAAEQREGRQPRRPPLVIPPGIPGADAPPIQLPRSRPERERALKQLYPDLPPLPADLQIAPGPEARPLTLSDLQSLAAANNPSIKNAIAGIGAARGALIQAGAYPNPTIAWEQDTIGTNEGYQGGYVDQVFKGANKLKLARAAAEMDLRNAELALRRAKSDLATQVRSSYFAVLVAAENIKVSKALAVFTDRVYAVQLDLVAGGVAAPYEPMQLRPLVLQARLNLQQARNQYLTSWKQLAAALGLPGMPPTELAGRVTLPVPVFEYQDVLGRVLQRHTDVLTAQNSLQRARYNLELAQVQPVPDVEARMLVQKDYTTPPHLMAYSFIVSLPVPIWDQNKGNILQARNQLIQAAQQPHMAQLQLTSTLADAFNRYVTAREQVQTALQQVRDQVRAYRGVYERRGQAPDDVSFGDVVAAQQTLAGYISAYITALGAQWTAVVDVANLLQTDDLFQVSRTEDVTPIPDLDQFLPPRCCHAGGRCPAKCLPAAVDQERMAGPEKGEHPVQPAHLRGSSGPEPGPRDGEGTKCPRVPPAPTPAPVEVLTPEPAETRSTK
jgi:cobalt-zinc-cadmium efflux system outer membrane protein